MTSPRIAVIINPISGRRGTHLREADRREALVRAVLADHAVDARVYRTTGPHHATTLAASSVADGCTVVVAMGGDGTVNEVAQGLVGTSCALGIVPSGSGDGLARGLGLPRDVVRALGVALEGRTIAIDVGYVNDGLFLNVAGFGFDAAVAAAFARRRTRGLWGYVVTALKEVRRYHSPEYTLTTDGDTRTGRYFLVGVANGPQYGNGATLAPDADPGDGRLDVMLVNAGSALAQAWRARRLYWRPAAAAAGMRRLQARHITIEASRLEGHLDGEPRTMASPATVRVAPASLLVRVPREADR